MHKVDRMLKKSAYKFKELCAIYNVSPKTFRKWVRLACRQAGAPYGHYYMIWQVQLIVYKLGEPEGYEVEEDFYKGLLKNGEIDMNYITTAGKA